MPRDEFLITGMGGYSLSGNNAQAALQFWRLDAEGPVRVAEIALPGCCVDALAWNEEEHEILAYSGLSTQSRGFLTALDARTWLPTAVFDFEIVFGQKIIPHSSLDMDRLDYLLRDARACGVVYGEIDLDYLLNSIKVSETGALGVKRKALAAAEHFLLARVFMYRGVYYHKTTYGLEEACRQLLWRLRKRGDFGGAVPVDGTTINEVASGPGLVDFTDVFVDRIVHQAYRESGDAVIKALATCLVERKPPRCLVDIGELFPRKPGSTKASLFRERCRDRLPALAQEYGLDVGQFLLCGPKPIKFEERKATFSRAEVRDLKPEEHEELIKVFVGSEDEPVSIVDVEGSLMTRLCNDEFVIQRLYLADHSLGEGRLEELTRKVMKWTEDPK